MAYITSDDMATWLGETTLRQLSNLDQAAATVDTDAVDEAIADAEAEINAVLAVRYTLPLSSPYPTIVVALAKRLTRWRLYDRQPGEPPPSVVKSFERDRDILRQLRKGEALPGLNTAGEVATAAASPRARIHGSGQGRVFGSGGMTGF